jgi:hypothetical protein
MITLNKNILSVLNETAELMYDEYKTRLINSNINATSELYNTLSFEVSSNEQAYLIKFYALDYWKNIEYGRKPGKFPNIGAIQKWIEIKPIIPKPYKGKIPTPKQLSYIISRSIAKKGIPAKNVLNNTLNEVMKVQTDKIKKAIGNDYELQVGIMIQEELNSKNIKTKITK